jgi:hypothetical protein
LTLLVFAVAFLAYILLLTKNYYWDGIFFAQVIEDAPRVNATLIHPNHLLDQVIEYFGYRAVIALGFHARALLVLQVSNCVLGALAVAICFRICFDWFRSFYVSIVTAAVFAFSATWWRFATDANTYVVAVLFVLGAFYFLSPERKPRPFAVAVLHAVAMLLHQLTVFFFPAAIVGLILQTRDKPKNQRQAIVLGYVVPVVLITLGVYYSVFHLATGLWGPGRFVSWITYFSPENGFTFSAIGNLSYSVRSQVRTMFGGRIAFVREFGGPRMITLTALTALALLSFIFVLITRFKEWRGVIAAAVHLPPRLKSLTLACAVWIIPYVVFLFFFIPQNTFYRLFYLPPIMFIVGAMLAAIESSPYHTRRYRAACFALVIFLANLTFSQYPYTQVRANPPLELALKLNQVWPTGTTVYFAAPTTDGALIRYFNPGTVWVQVASAEIAPKLENLTSARTAWLDTTLVDQMEASAEGRAWLASHAVRRSDCELVNNKYRIRFYQLKADSFGVTEPRTIVSGTSSQLAFNERRYCARCGFIPLATARGSEKR